MNPPAPPSPAHSAIQYAHSKSQHFKSLAHINKTKKFQQKNINNQLNKNKGIRAMGQLALLSVSGLQSRLTRALHRVQSVYEIQK